MFEEPLSTLRADLANIWISIVNEMHAIWWESVRPSSFHYFTFVDARQGELRLTVDVDVQRQYDRLPNISITFLFLMIYLRAPDWKEKTFVRQNEIMRTASRAMREMFIYFHLRRIQTEWIQICDSIFHFRSFFITKQIYIACKRMGIFFRLRRLKFNITTRARFANSFGFELTETHIVYAPFTTPISVNVTCNSLISIAFKPAATACLPSNFYFCRLSRCLCANAVAWKLLAQIDFEINGDGFGSILCMKPRFICLRGFASETCKSIRDISMVLYHSAKIIKWKC